MWVLDVKEQKIVRISTATYWSDKARYASATSRRMKEWKQKQSTIDDTNKVVEGDNLFRSIEKLLAFD
jgi:hypothetical protein